MTERICPVPGCGAHIKRRGYLMCRDCWSRVPRSLQRDVNRSWRNVKNGNDVPVSRRERMNVYIAVVAAAVSASEEAR